MQIIGHRKPFATLCCWSPFARGSCMRGPFSARQDMAARIEVVG
jgi:hypothetical protein